MSNEYIGSAKKRNLLIKMHLYCIIMTSEVINDLKLQNNFDIILGLNLLYHLNDMEAITFIEICHLL